MVYLDIVFIGDVRDVESRQYGRHVRISLTIKEDGVPITVQTTVRGLTTNLTVVRDTIRPTVLISPYHHPAVDPQTGQTRLFVEFSERRFNKQVVNCSERETINPSSSLQEKIQASRSCQLTTSDITRESLINVSSSKKLSGMLLLVEFHQVTEYADAQLHQLGDDTLYLTFEVNSTNQTNIEVNLPAESFCDIAGNTNNANFSHVIYYRPTVGSPTIQRSIRLLARNVSLQGTDVPFDEDNETSGFSAGALIGQAATAAVAGTIAASAASGGATGAGGQSIPFFLLGLLQKLFLTGHIAAVEMPDLYADFAGQLGWAMFDFSSPFEAFVDKDESLEADEDAAEDAAEDALELRTRTDAYIYIARVFFWVPLLFIILLLIHALILLHFIRRKLPIPFIFAFPRLELIFSYWMLPAVAVAICGLYRGDKMDALIATWLLIAFPGSAIAGNLYLLWFFFYSKDARHRSANFVVASGKKDPRELTEIYKDWKRRKMIDFAARRKPHVNVVNAIYIPKSSTLATSERDSALAPNAVLTNPVAEAHASNREAFHVGYMTERNLVPLENELLIQGTTWRRSRGLPSGNPLVANALRGSNELMKNQELVNIEYSPFMQQDHLDNILGNSLSSPTKIADYCFEVRQESAVSPQYAENREDIVSRSSPSGRPTPLNISQTNPVPSNSGNSSLNNSPYSSIGYTLATDVQIKPLDSRASHQIERGRSDQMSRKKPSNCRSRRVKKGTSAPLMGRASNNIASLLNSTIEQSSHESSIRPLPSEPNHSQFQPTSSHKITIDNLIFDGGKDGPSTEAGFYSTLQKRPDMTQSMKRNDFKLSPNFTPIVCSKAPEPLWNIINVDKIIQEFEKGDKLQSSQNTQPKDETFESSLLEGMPSSSQSRPLENSMTDMANWRERDASTSTTGARNGVFSHHSFSRNIRSDPYSATGVQSSDYPTILDPEPFAETKERLRFINNECLMDIKCAYLIDSDTDSAPSSGESEVEYKHKSKTTKKQPRSKSALFWTLLGEAVDASFYSFIFGHPQLKGVWKSTPTRNPSFIQQYGYMFEDFRGHPVLYREPTYKVKTNGLDRGKFIPLKVPPVINVKSWRIPMTDYWTPSMQVYPYQVQLLTRLLRLLKIIVLGCIIAGVGSGRDSLIQIIVLFILCLFLFLTLRIAQPYRNRYRMALALSEDVSDVTFLTLAMLLILGPHENKTFRTRLGIGMLLCQLTSFLAIVLDRLVVALIGFGSAWKRARARRPTKVEKVFREYMRKNLYCWERKYFDIWMIKALKKGLYNRVVRREEFPLSYVRSWYIERFKKSVSWLRNEVNLVRIDFNNKLRKTAIA
eukprot:g2647.t1